MLSKFTKRLIDLILAALLFIALLPLLVFISILVLVYLGFPIFFIQKRVGYLGSQFYVYKFRTMNSLSDKNGVLREDDYLRTRFGDFLRATSLDELPQLINIILGQMSFVGPRPLLPEYLPLYSSRQAMRHNAKPGLTGLAQISGRNNISWQRKFRLDVWYVKNHSLKLDVVIFFRTIKKVILREGILSANNSMIKKFEGNIE